MPVTKTLVYSLLQVVLVNLNLFKNSTDDLEVRVTILEEDVADLESDVADLITDDNLQDERLNIMEESINENGNDIDGTTSVCLKTKAILFSSEISNNAIKVKILLRNLF